MKRLAAIATLLGTLLLAGCGGSGSTIIGTNSDMVVHIKRTVNTQDLMQYEVYVTKNRDTTLDENDPEDSISTSNKPTWVDHYSAHRTSSELILRFRTRDDHVPYFVFVKVPTTANAQENLTLQIDVDAVVGVERPILVDSNSTQMLTGVHIERNTAVY